MDGGNDIIIVQWGPFDRVIPCTTVVIDSVQVVRDDIQLIKLKCWESIARHCAPSRVSKLDLNVELSCQSFESDCFRELLDISDGDIVNHSYCRAAESALPSSYLLVRYSTWVASSKCDGVKVLGVLLGD